MAQPSKIGGEGGCCWIKATCLVYQVLQNLNQSGPVAPAAQRSTQLLLVLQLGNGQTWLDFKGQEKN